MSDPGRVSPEDMEAMRAAPDCGRMHGVGYSGGGASAYAVQCDACARLLYLAIARRTEERVREQHRNLMQRYDVIAGEYAIERMGLLPRLCPEGE